MERGKMSEEIATCFCGYYDDENGKCKLYLHRPLCKDFDKNCIYRRKAINIVDKYIPDTAVVLTKEEYADLTSLSDSYDTLEERYCTLMESVGEKVIKARKETANEVFELWANDLRDLLNKNFIEQDVFDECIKYVYDLKSKF